MATTYRVAVLVLALTVGAVILCPPDSLAQASRRDGIGELIAQEGQDLDSNAQQEAAQDVREGSVEYEQARRLMKAVDAILEDAAKHRAEARKLPSRKDFVVTPIWTETREDRERKIRDLLDAALGIVTDVPVVAVQRRIETLRKNIRDLEDRIVKLKEKQLVAPQDAILPGVLSDTVESLERDIQESQRRIEENRKAIEAAKAEVHQALKASGLDLSAEQVDLLLDSVLSGDLVRLAAVFNSAKLVDRQLAKMLNASGNNMNAARKYFAMHAALFAMLVHAQDTLIDKIDNNYAQARCHHEGHRGGPAQDERAAKG